MKKCILLLLCAAFLASAADAPKQHRSRKVWWASVAALLAASAVDSHSSYGHLEANPILRSRDGSFGRRGLAIKFALTGLAVGVEWLILRKDPDSARMFSIVNFSSAGAITGVGIRNYHRRVPVKEMFHAGQPAAPSNPAGPSAVP